MEDVLLMLQREGNMTGAEVAASQFFSRGPGRVSHWAHLDRSFAQATRSQLGFIEFDTECITLLCCSDDSEGEGEEEEDDGDDDQSVSDS